MASLKVLFFAFAIASLAFVVVCDVNQDTDPSKFKDVVPTWNITAQPDQIADVAIGCGKGGTSCSFSTCCPSTTPVCCGEYCCNPGNICCGGQCSNQLCAVGCCQPPYVCCGNSQCCV